MPGLGMPAGGSGAPVRGLPREGAAARCSDPARSALPRGGNSGPGRSFEILPSPPGTCWQAGAGWAGGRGGAGGGQPSPLLSSPRSRRRLGARARRSETPCFFPLGFSCEEGNSFPAAGSRGGGTVPGPPPPSPPPALAGGGSGRTAAAPPPRAAACRRQQPGGAARLAREPLAAAVLAQQDPGDRPRSPRGELPPAQLAPSSPLRRVGTRRGCGTRWGSANICGLALQEKSKGNEGGYCPPAALPAPRPAFLKPVLGCFRIWMNSVSWGCRKHGAGSRALGKC